MSRTLLEQWKDIAYDESADRATLQRFWGTYFQIEKEIYEQLLSNPDEEVKGTVKELAEKYGQEVLTMVGFLDGIDESLKEPNPIETMDEDTVVSLAFDKEKLYKNMVAAKADWLYELPQWKEIYSEEELKKLYKEQKESTTIRKEKKIGRNDPCHVKQVFPLLFPISKFRLKRQRFWLLRKKKSIKLSVCSVVV